jgi:hypothetical protein
VIVLATILHGQAALHPGPAGGLTGAHHARPASPGRVPRS